MAEKPEEVINDIDALLKKLLELQNTPAELEALDYDVAKVREAAKKYDPANKVGSSYITWIMDYVGAAKDDAKNSKEVKKEDINDEDFVVVDYVSDGEDPEKSSRLSSSASTPLGSPVKKQ